VVIKKQEFNVVDLEEGIQTRVSRFGEVDRQVGGT
jgi:hypothetical protein